jgi:hypothetical protein
MSTEQKLTVLAAQLLLDSRLFDGDTKKCENLMKLCLADTTDRVSRRWLR